MIHTITPKTSANTKNSLVEDMVCKVNKGKFTDTVIIIKTHPEVCKVKSIETGKVYVRKHEDLTPIKVSWTVKKFWETGEIYDPALTTKGKKSYKPLKEPVDLRQKHVELRHVNTYNIRGLMDNIAPQEKWEASAAL